MDSRIEAAIPALTSPEAVAVARQRVAEAVAAGELPLGDATQVMELLAAVESSLMAAEKRQLLAAVRSAIAENRGGGPATRAAVLASQAAALLEILPARPGDGARLISGEVEPVE